MHKRLNDGHQPYRLYQVSVPLCYLKETQPQSHDSRPGGEFERLEQARAVAEKRPGLRREVENETFSKHEPMQEGATHGLTAIPQRACLSTDCTGSERTRPHIAFCTEVRRIKQEILARGMLINAG